MNIAYIVISVTLCVISFAIGFCVGRNDGFDEAEDVYYTFYGIPKARRK